MKKLAFIDFFSIGIALTFLSLHACSYPNKQIYNSSDKNQEAPSSIYPGMSPPVLIKSVEPRYPYKARKERIEGTVILEAVVEKSGKIQNLKVLTSAHPLLDEAAMKAVRKWRYKPALLFGKPVRVYFKVTVIFTIPD